MNNTLKTFNSWLLSKITSYLSKHEGYKMHISQYTNEGVMAIVSDGFGQRYEIHIKSLDNNANEDDNDFTFSKTSSVSFHESNATKTRYCGQD